MARVIDASHFGEVLEQWKKDCLECDDQHGADVIADVILQLDDMPTLTQPNEGAKDKNVPTNEPLTEVEKIADILINADAVMCVPNFAPQRYFSNVLYEIPMGYTVTVNVRKLATALLDAGYRKGET